MARTTPVVKWAGGKRQLLEELLPLVPQTYGTYYEPFLGGGALFFALEPPRAVISDSNPELIHMYRELAHNVDAVLDALRQCEDTPEQYQQLRSTNPAELPGPVAAARTIFLNHTGFNGLHRVNRRGEFNVPYGRRARPYVANQIEIRRASFALSRAEIVCEDYETLLSSRARPGDFIFLDPPYVPVSAYSDFDRYTKDTFGRDDHLRVAACFNDLVELGCYPILTNSNADLVPELYGQHDIHVVSTRRAINSDITKRNGEDVIILPKRRTIHPVQTSIPLNTGEAVDVRGQIANFPTTRYMGSKFKLLTPLREVFDSLDFTSALDLFSGTGVVSYLLKTMGRQVTAVDFMAMNHRAASAMIENSAVTLSECELESLLDRSVETDGFVRRTFAGLYFTDDENQLIDVIRTNIRKLQCAYKRDIAMTALIRACTRRRPRGIFTYTGYRYDDGRQDLRRPLEDHFRRSVDAVNSAVFSNGLDHRAVWGDALSVRETVDLVYLDPPYFSPHSDNDYVRRYHFVEGLARNWEGLALQEHTKTRKFRSYASPFATERGTHEALSTMASTFRGRHLVLSYSSNSLPTLDTLVRLLELTCARVEVVDVPHRYSFSTRNGANGVPRNRVTEYVIVGSP